MTTRRMVLVIAPTYAEAAATMRGRILPADTDWHWLIDTTTAIRWLARCERRGVLIDATWLYPATQRLERSA
jgi:hypothetical protein